jgi:hypothetical protein
MQLASADGLKFSRLWCRSWNVDLMVIGFGRSMAAGYPQEEAQIAEAHVQPFKGIISPGVVAATPAGRV